MHTSGSGHRPVPYDERRGRAIRPRRSVVCPLSPVVCLVGPVARGEPPSVLPGLDLKFG